MKELVKQRIILEDGSWPVLTWNHAKQDYDLAQTPSMKMNTMHSLVRELQELGTEQHRIV